MREQIAEVGADERGEPGRGAGAVALAPGDVDALASTVLPDKNVAIVTYCTGPSDRKSVV